MHIRYEFAVAQLGFTDMSDRWQNEADVYEPNFSGKDFVISYFGACLIHDEQTHFGALTMIHLCQSRGNSKHFRLGRSVRLSLPQSDPNHVLDCWHCGNHPS